MKALIIAIVGRPKPPTTRLHPIEALKSKGLYIAFSWFIFELSLEQFMITDCVAISDHRTMTQDICSVEHLRS